MWLRLQDQATGMRQFVSIQSCMQTGSLPTARRTAIGEYSKVASSHMSGEQLYYSFHIKHVGVENLQKQQLQKFTMHFTVLDRSASTTKLMLSRVAFQIVSQDAYVKKAVTLV